MCAVTCATPPVWRSEDNFKEFLFYHICPGDLIQVVRLEGKHLHPLSHFISPVLRISTEGNRCQGFRAQIGRRQQSSTKNADFQVGQRPSKGESSAAISWGDTSCLWEDYRKVV